MTKAGAATKILESTGKVLSGPAQPVTLQTTPSAIEAGAALPAQLVSAAYVTAHGLKAGEPLPVYQVTTGKVKAGPVVPVYVVSL